MTSKVIPLRPRLGAAQPPTAPAQPAPPPQAEARQPAQAPSEPERPARDFAPTIQRALAGDPNAMQELVLVMLPRVRNLVRYLVRGDDIDDLSQDALLKVLERLSSYRAEGRFESWVDGVTLRVTLRALGKRRAEARRTDGTDSDELAAPRAETASPHYLSRRRVVQALDELPDAQRHALVMHHVLGMTAAEIADELTVPLETVRSRLRLGMGQLRAVMGVFSQREQA